MTKIIEFSGIWGKSDKFAIVLLKSDLFKMSYLAHLKLAKGLSLLFKQFKLQSCYVQINYHLRCK